MTRSQIRIRVVSLLLQLAALTSAASAQPALKWQHALGDSHVDKGYAVVPVETEHATQYIITGTTRPPTVPGTGM